MGARRARACLCVKLFSSCLLEIPVHRVRIVCMLRVGGIVHRFRVVVGLRGCNFGFDCNCSCRRWSDDCDGGCCSC